MADAIERVGPALDAIGALLQRLVEHGLQRATASALVEVRAVAQQAQQARLVNLERELTALASLLERYLARDPLFRPGQWVAGCNRVWLQVGATRRALGSAEASGDLEAVAGVPRRRYEPHPGLIDVQAVAADGWRTDSGYVGVTVHLWWAAESRWLQATNVRPEALVGPVPARLARMSISEDVPMALGELSHGAWTLDGACLSADGRVSLGRGLVMIPGAPMGRRALDALHVPTAAAIVDRLLAAELDPIRGVGSTLVYLEPVAFTDVRVDDTRGRALGGVRDAEGAVVAVHVPIAPENDALIDNLEALGKQWRPDGLIARAWLARGELQLHPISAVFAEPVKLKGVRQPAHEVHLTFEALESARR